MCPYCKIFAADGDSVCSKCGQDLSVELPHTSEGSEDRGSAPASDLPNGGDMPGGGMPFTIELDTMLSLQEDVGNSLRILFTPSAGTFSDVSISLSSDDKSFQTKTRQRKVLSSPYEFVFGVRNLKAGVWVFDVNVSYVLDRREYSYDGTFDVAVLERRNWQSDAKRNLSFVFNPVIHASEAGRVRIDGPEHVKSLLAQAEKDAERDPLKTAEELINLGVRKYRKITVQLLDVVEFLPPPPSEAVCKEIQLDLGYGYGQVQFFTDSIIGIGHTFEGVRYTDIVVDPPAGLAGDQRLPYEKMSRGQCILRSCGIDVELVDGRIRKSGELAGSTNGTYLNGERVGSGGCRLPQNGAIGLGTTCRETTLDATLVTPSPEACRRCRRGSESREYCSRDGRACVNAVLRRRDGVDLVYVALWSCIDMGYICRHFAGLEISYDRQAFAWRRGVQRGWLVPGARIEMPRMSISISSVRNECCGIQANSQCVTKKGDSE